MSNERHDDFVEAMKKTHRAIAGPVRVGCVGIVIGVLALLAGAVRYVWLLKPGGCP